MFKKNIVLLVMVAITSVFFPNLVVAQSTVSDDHREMLKTFEKKWLEYFQSLGRVEGTKHVQYKRNGDVESEHEDKLVFLYPLMIESRGQTSDYDSAAVFGKSYEFLLHKSENRKWIIKRIACKLSEARPKSLSFPVYRGDPQLRNPTANLVFVALGVGLFGMHGVHLPDMIIVSNDRLFTVNEFRKTEKNGVEGYILNFDFSIDNHESVKNEPEWLSGKYKKYTLHGNLFLTTDYFLVTEGEYHLEYYNFSRKAKINISYDKETYKVPLPKNYYLTQETRSYVDNQININEDIYSFDLHETNPKDRKRFTLSAYGLPEYECRTTQEIRVDRTRYVLIGLGLLLTGLGILLIIRKRMKRQSDLNDAK